MRFNIKSRNGFTLIELLVVIGILAVLAAIAIPSVAGLIDKANISADANNADAYTNALERFVSEYEMVKLDIASDTFDKNNMDATQSRVYNVTKAETREHIEKLEGTGYNGIVLHKDTKYPANELTAKTIMQNYAKTSSETFAPKRSNYSYWYSEDCGIIVCAKTNATVLELNSLILSGKDASGKDLKPNATWRNLTNSSVAEGSVPTETYNTILWGRPYASEIYWSSYDETYKRVIFTFNADGSYNVKVYRYDETASEIIYSHDMDNSGFYYSSDLKIAFWGGFEECDASEIFYLSEDGRSIDHYYSDYGYETTYYLQ